jgi:hypothetical protein
LPLPTGARVQAGVQPRQAAVDDAAAGRRYFGEPLLAALRRIAATEDPQAAERKQLWLVEAALGTHYLEAAGRLWAEDAEMLRPILLDDWLIDYEQYARGVSNPPDAAGHLWRIPEAGWSRDAVPAVGRAQAPAHDHASSPGSIPHDAWCGRTGAAAAAGRLRARGRGRPCTGSARCSGRRRRAGGAPGGGGARRRDVRGARSLAADLPAPPAAGLPRQTDGGRTLGQ